MKNNKVCVICEFYSFAVWPAIKLHINSMLQGGSIPVLLVSEKNRGIVQSDFPGYECVIFKNYVDLGINILKLNHVKYVWCPDLFVLLKTYLFALCARKRVIFWVQGILPEEHYMKFHSKMKFYVLNVLEYLSLIVSDKIVVVSDTMKEFLKKKYCLQYKEKRFYIIPCISELQYIEGTEKIKKSYIYIGGLSVWQKFDDILILYHQIQLKEPDSIFHIVTLDVGTAQKKVDEIFTDQKNILIYSVTNRNEISSVLSKFEYGFLIRENNKVNEVASPIKFAEYLSCGIRPIMTDAIPHYTTLIEKYSCGLILNDNQITTINHVGDETSPIKAYNDYFSSDKFIDSYKMILQK